MQVRLAFSIAIRAKGDILVLDEVLAVGDAAFQEKCNAILDIYKAIHYLHQHNICLGDIHLDNFLISKNGQGYVIDLDYMVFPGNEWKFQQMYCIKLMIIYYTSV